MTLTLKFAVLCGVMVKVLYLGAVHFGFESSLVCKLSYFKLMLFLKDRFYF